MTKNKFYLSALFLFSSFGQGFGITETLANRTIEIYNKFFTPGQNHYEGVLGNLWPEILTKLNSWSFTPSQSRPNTRYLIIGSNASEPLKYVFSEYFPNQDNRIQTTQFQKFYNQKLLSFARRDDLAFIDYHNFIVNLDRFIAKIELAGCQEMSDVFSIEQADIFLDLSDDFFATLKHLTSLDFIMISKNQDLEAIRKNNIKTLQNFAFSIIFFALTIENGLFNGLNTDQTEELIKYINELINKAYPLKLEYVEQNCSETEGSDFDK